MQTEWNHLNGELVAGVSDPGERDMSLNNNVPAAKNVPMPKSEDSKKMHEESKKAKMTDESKKLAIAKSSESGSVRQSEKSPPTLGHDIAKNLQNGILQKALRAVTPTPEKLSEVHRTSKDRQENPFPVPHLCKTG